MKFFASIFFGIAEGFIAIGEYFAENRDDEQAEKIEQFDSKLVEAEFGAVVASRVAQAQRAQHARRLRGQLSRVLGVEIVEVWVP